MEIDELSSNKIYKITKNNYELENKKRKSEGRKKFESLIEKYSLKSIHLLIPAHRLIPIFQPNPIQSFFKSNIKKKEKKNN